MVNALKTHDSWDMCLCSLQTRALKSGTCQQPNFSKLQKPNVFFPRTLCNGYWEREDNVVQSAKGMQTWHFFFPLLLLFVDVCFTKSVNCCVLRLFHKSQLIVMFCACSLWRMTIVMFCACFLWHMTIATSLVFAN